MCHKTNARSDRSNRARTLLEHAERPKRGLAVQTPPVTPQGSRRDSDTGGRPRVVAWRGFLAVESRGTVADQAARVARFLLADLIGLRLRSVPSPDREDQGHYAQGQAPSRRSHVALNSLAAARTKRGVGRPLAGEQRRRRRATSIRPRHVCQPLLLVARTAHKRMTPTYSAVPPPRAQLAVKPSGGALRC
jgi:hypothetical protein